MITFPVYSATPDEQGTAAIQSAVAFAKANPLMPVTIDGFSHGQYTNQVDTMSEERVRVVASMMVQGGIGRERIDILGKSGSIAYAQGSPMAQLPPNTVKLGVGL
jgi:outer membrane protein OmpA-like peptidoglycan-associated protein